MRADLPSTEIRAQRDREPENSRWAWLVAFSVLVCACAAYAIIVARLDGRARAPRPSATHGRDDARPRARLTDDARNVQRNDERRAPTARVVPAPRPRPRPTELGIPEMPTTPALAFDYAFSRPRGARAYRRAADARHQRRGTEIGPGWGLAIVERKRVRGRAMVKTSRGSWVLARDLVRARPSRFSGVFLRGDAQGPELDVAWVRRGGARALVQPTAASANAHAAEGVRRLRARARVEPTGQARDGSEAFTRLADGRFVQSSRLIRPVRTAPPAGVSADERWIDVDLARQTLVAYRGSTPVFATLVSTGVEETPTPTGLFRIAIKLENDRMDDLLDDDPGNRYSMDRVPWVQYFSGDIGFHAAYWHDRFGAPRSHGCVNLAPRDAQWLYAFTTPSVREGAHEARASDQDPGTAVYVH